MKKTTALFLALSLLLLVSGAFAANPIAVGITAIDYQTGAVIGPKNYSVNELFTVRVTVSIPRFTDTSNLTVKLRTDGLTLFEPQIDLRSGEYYLSGVITRQPASLTVEIRDHSFDNANTAEELYNAIQFDRSTAATYKFSVAQASTTTTTTTIVKQLPKTGGPSALGSSILLLVCAALVFKNRKRY